VPQLHTATSRTIWLSKRRVRARGCTGTSVRHLDLALLREALTASAIVQAVPGAVDEEVQARLKESLYDALLQAAVAPGGPHV
jgi:hypothetical protein